MAWYNIAIAHDDKTFHAHQQHLRALVDLARKGDADSQQKVAHNVYMKWRRSSDGRKYDTGIEFTYAQLSIVDDPESSEDQHRLFEALPPGS